MDEQRKMYRVFQLIARLRSPVGCIKKDVARDFEVTERTIERHFRLLTDLGFDIVKEGNRFKIEGIEKRKLKHEDMIVFNLEEAIIIRDALLSCSTEGPLRKSLLEKLYALTELEELSETIYKQAVSKNISTIRLAIKSRQQVQLKDYQSASSECARDYLIEPIRFYQYYNYLLAYDISDEKVKQFKTERISGAEITDREWTHEKEHRQKIVDPFGMTGDEEIRVVMELSMRARMLLEEEFPEAGTFLHHEGNKWIWDGKVSSLKGIGRFVMGLMDEVVITEPQELKEYIFGKIKKVSNATLFVGKGD